MIDIHSIFIIYILKPWVKKIINESLIQNIVRLWQYPEKLKENLDIYTMEFSKKYKALLDLMKTQT